MYAVSSNLHFTFVSAAVRKGSWLQRSVFSPATGMDRWREFEPNCGPGCSSHGPVQKSWRECLSRDKQYNATLIFPTGQSNSQKKQSFYICRNNNYLTNIDRPFGEFGFCSENFLSFFTWKIFRNNRINYLGFIIIDDT